MNINIFDNDSKNEKTAEKFQVMVVDDEPISLEIVSQQLKAQDIIVTKAKDGIEALSEISKGLRPDLILLDIIMPVKTGFEVCKELREEFSSNELPIIMLTGQDQVSEIVKGFEAGANDYLTKPVSNNELMARLKTHINISRLNKSLKHANQRVEEQKVKLEISNKFIKSTFGRYLSDDIVNSILNTPEGLKLGGEKRKVSLMMSDLRGFTSIGERLPPEDVLMILNIYLETMTDIILKYQGTIDEFIGDAIFVIFGAPIPQKDDAMRAIACAIEMQLAMESVNKKNIESGYPEVSMGIGINTGEAIVGNIGSIKRAKYGAIGYNVNLTSRIESYTVGGQILISENTYKECYSIIEVQDQLEVMPKGLQEPINIYDVTCIKGNYNKSLHIDKKNILLNDLKNPIKILFGILEGKDTSMDMYEAEIIKKSLKKLAIKSNKIPGRLSNLKIIFFDKNGNSMFNDLYGKITEISSNKEYNFIVHLTYMPPDAELFLNNSL